ncbi:threonylcarbamoyl-AMP synthase [bacterium K02(2017)]|nr:threonylcarbamoyl-AMP synthase [bacterium K02(2017)]
MPLLMKINLSKAIELINNKQLVAVPTETVYGLAASIKYPEAINKIYKIKQRPLDKALSILISQKSHLQELSLNFPTQYNKIMSFWPGPLTIVLEANLKQVPAELRAGGKTVALRMPDHPILLDLLNKTGPLAAPSANISGFPAPINTQEVRQNLGDDFPILDGGDCQLATESTIVSLVGNSVKILRQGAIPKTKIKSCLNLSE